MCCKKVVPDKLVGNPIEIVSKDGGNPLVRLLEVTERWQPCKQFVTCRVAEDLEASSKITSVLAT
jgi:hypothetical protein